ncbi:hypothetical protein [Variovorax sp. CCNWLW186]|uniref:hypothetical protein n=1 Tax=Variovorax sp. CCNWLW186 TaxID=3127473 RepID=UPI003076D1F2
MKHFVGRQDSAARLKAVLRGEERSRSGKLSVLSVEGPGGIGKTSFFDHVSQEIDLDARNFLVVRIGGNGDTGKSVQHAVRSLTAQPSSKNLPLRPPGAYFPGLLEAVTAYEDILREALEEYARSPAQDTAAEMVMSAIDVLVGLGKPVNKLVPKTEEYLNFSELGKHRDGISKALAGLSALQSSDIGFLEKLGLDSSATMRNALKKGPLQVFSQRLYEDLSAILVGYDSKDFFKPKLAKFEKVDRLLLIIDDYEAVKGSLERFLVDHFLPLLKDAKFDTIAVIIGRDRLADTASGDWDRQLGGVLLDPITLRGLNRIELDELARLNGIDDPLELERAWRDTEGYPFFIQLWLEEAQSGGRSAMLLKRAYERTTKWMNDEERRWLAHALILDKVDIRQFRTVLGDEQEARRAFAWFEGDASVRDPEGKTFKVREYLRSRLFDYIELSDPDFHDDLLRRRAAIAVSQ